MLTKNKFLITKYAAITLKLVQLFLQGGMIYYSEISNEGDYFLTFPIVMNAFAFFIILCFLFFTVRKIRALYIYQQELIASVIFGVFYGTYIIWLSYYYSSNKCSVNENSESIQIYNKLLDDRRILFYKTIIVLVVILIFEFPILYLTFLMKSLIRELAREANRPQLSVQEQQSFQLHQRFIQQQQQSAEQQDVQQVVEQQSSHLSGLSFNEEHASIQQQHNSNVNNVRFQSCVREINESIEEITNNLFELDSSLISLSNPVLAQSQQDELDSSVQCEVQPEQNIQNVCATQYQVRTNVAAPSNVDRNILPPLVSEIIYNITYENPSLATSAEPIEIQHEQNVQNVLSPHQESELELEVTEDKENIQYQDNIPLL